MADLNFKTDGQSSIREAVNSKLKSKDFMIGLAAGCAVGIIPIPYLVKVALTAGFATHVICSYQRDRLANESVENHAPNTSSNNEEAGV